MADGRRVYQVIIDAQKAIEGSKAATKAFSEIEGAGVRLQKSLSLIRNAFAGLGIAFGLHELARLTDEWDDLNDKLKIVSHSNAELAQAQKSVLEIANLTATDMTKVADAYSDVARATEKLGISQKDAAQLTKNVAEAFTLSGASAEQFASGIDTLTTALVKGGLSEKQFVELAKTAPALIDALAAATGRSREALQKMAAQGKLTTEVLSQGLLKATDDLAKRMGEVAPTIGDAFTAVKNSVLNFIGQLDQASGASSMIAQGIMLVSKALDFLAGNLDIVTAAFAALAVMALPAIFAQISAGVGAVVSAVKALTIAMMANPLLALATAAAALIGYLWNNVDAMKAMTGYATDLGTVVSVVFDDMVKWAKDAGGKISDWISGAWDYISSLWGQAADWFQNSVFSKIAGYVKTAANYWIGTYVAIYNVITTLFQKLPEFFSKILDSISASFASLWEAFKAGDVSKIQAPLAGLGAEMTKLAGDVAKSAGDAFGTDYVGAIGNAISSGASSVVSTVADSLAPVASYADDVMKRAEERTKAAGAAADKAAPSYGKLTENIEGTSKAAETLAKNIAKATAQLEAKAKADERRLAAMGQGEAAMEALNRQLYIEGELASAGADATSKLGKELEAAAGHAYDANKALEDQKKALDAQKEAAKKAADAIKEQADKMTDAVTDYAADAFADMFGENRKGWKDMLDDFQTWARQTFARIAAEAVIRPIIAPIMQGMAGGMAGGGSALGGLGGGFNFANLGASIFGTGGQPMPGTVGPPTAAQSQGIFGGGFSGMSAGLTAGMSIMPLVSTLLSGTKLKDIGGTALGTGIGGAVGGIAGSFFGPVGGMLGQMVGSMLGGVIGGLFGDPNNFPKAAAYFTTSGGMFAGKGAAQQHGGPLDAVTKLQAGIVDQVNAMLTDMGASISGQLGYFGPGGIGGIQLKAGKAYTVVGGKVEAFGSGEEGAQAAVENFITETFQQMAKGGGITGISDTLKTVLSKSTTNSLKELTEQINFAKWYDGLGKTEEEISDAAAALKALNDQFAAMRKQAEGFGLDLGKIDDALASARQKLTDEFNRGIQDQIQAIEDPMAYAIKQLDAQFEVIRQNATDLGADMVAIDKLYGLKRAAIIEQYNAAAAQSFKSILDMIHQLTATTGSPLAPTTALANAEQLFASMKALAQAGDPAALSGIAQAGQNLLDLSREVYASGAQYFERFDYVIASLSALLPGGTAANDNRSIPTLLDGLGQETARQTATAQEDAAAIRAQLIILTETVAAQQAALDRLAYRAAVP